MEKQNRMHTKKDGVRLRGLKRKRISVFEKTKGKGETPVVVVVVEKGDRSERKEKKNKREANNKA